MSKSRIAIIALACALVISNTLWAYSLTFGKVPEPAAQMKCEPSEQTAEIYDAIVVPLMGAIESSANPGATKDSVVSAASLSNLRDDSLCMDDQRVVRVHGVGLIFDKSEKLVGATATQCPP